MMPNNNSTRRKILQLSAGYGVTSLWSIVHAPQTTDRSNTTLERWTVSLDGLIRGSPTINDETVYIGSADDQLYAIDTTTGDTRWTETTGGDIRSSPTVSDGAVYIGSRDQAVYAFDTETGDEHWRTDLGTSIMASSPTLGEDIVCVGGWDGGVYALDPATGREHWTYETDASIQHPSPTIVDGTVYIGSGDGSVYALDADSGDEHWVFDTDGDVRSSPTVVDGTVYVGSFDGNVYAISADSGDEQWIVETDGHIGNSSPTVANETVFIGSYDNHVYALDAATGDEQWAFDTGSTINSSPTVANGIVYTGTSAGRGVPTIFGIDAVRGHLVWQYGTDGPILSSPTVVDGTLYVGSYDATLYALPVHGDGSSIGSRVLLGTLGHHDRVSLGRSVNPPVDERSVVADFSLEPEEPTVGELVEFDAAASTADAEIEAYYWDFTGDEEVDATGDIVEYEFEDDGPQEVSVAVEDDTGSVDVATRLVTVEAAERDISVSIADTGGPVDGGDRLTPTVEITNEGETAHRPEVSLFFDEESGWSVTTTVDPGVTETVDMFGYQTYPVAEEDDVQIRVEAAGDTVEQTATVRAVDDIDDDDVRPTPAPTMQPATQLFFEVDDALTDDHGETHWYVDGVHEATSRGPWAGTYAHEIGYDYFNRTFDEPGTYEVTAAVVTDDGNAAYRWEVTVSEMGDEPPQIDSGRPIMSALGADEEQTLELEVASSATDLERVVWWMTQADSILGVSDLSGQQDTASLEIDGGCHTCRVRAWVFDDQNTYSSISPWEFEGHDDEDDHLAENDVNVMVFDTTSPVTPNDSVDVTVLLENTTNEEVTHEIEFAIGDEQETVETRSVTLTAGGVEQVTFTHEIGSGQEGRVPIIVQTPEQTVEDAVFVEEVSDEET